VIPPDPRKRGKGRTRSIPIRFLAVFSTIAGIQSENLPTIAISHPIGK